MGHFLITSPLSVRFQIKTAYLCFLGSDRELYVHYVHTHQKVASAMRAPCRNLGTTSIAYVFACNEEFAILNCICGGVFIVLNPSSLVSGVELRGMYSV